MGVGHLLSVRIRNGQVQADHVFFQVVAEGCVVSCRKSIEGRDNLAIRLVPQEIDNLGSIVFCNSVFDDDNQAVVRSVAAHKENAVIFGLLFQGLF